MPVLEQDEAIHLASEEEAWELLRRLIETEIQFDRPPKLTVGEWAKIDVYIPAERYDSAMTPYMMQGWVELQRSIYRAYSLAQGSGPIARSLTDREKERLELVVEVKSGSSDQTVDVQGIIDAFIAAMVNKMEPQHILIATVSLILTWGGTSILNNWLATRKEIKLAEIEAIKTKDTAQAHIAALQTIAEVAGVERQRAVLLAKAGEEVPLVKALEAEADRGREALVKHVTRDDAEVNGVPISAEAGQSITSRVRMESVEVRLDGLYKIRKVDTTVATGFRVHISDKDGRELVGDVAEVMTTMEDRKIIQDAEWEKSPVFLQINAKERRGDYMDAKILRARKYDPDTDGAWR